jgi:multicomponent K+:H+ antiporter subunit G
MTDIVNILAVVCLLTGGFFLFVGSVGLAKLPDFYTRLHAPTKATTLGVGAVLLGSMLLTSMRDGGISIHELVISLFLFITAPVSAHMMAKAALHKKVTALKETHNRQLMKRIAQQKTPE